MSRYDDINSALKAALGQILTANGYHTNAGQRVWQNLEYQTAPPDKPCMILYPGEVDDSLDGDPAPSQGEENHLLPIRVEGFIVDDEAGTRGSLLRQDIVKALKTDPYFAGLSEGFSGGFSSSATVEDGGEDGFLGMVEVNATLLYVTLYGEM